MRTRIREGGRAIRLRVVYERNVRLGYYAEEEEATLFHTLGNT